MAARKGNQDWKKRFKHGKDKMFSTPELMLEAYMEYRQHEEENPFFEVEKGQGNSSRVIDKIVGRGKNARTVMKDNVIKLPRIKALSLRGFCVYWGLSVTYFNTFLRDLKNDDPHREDYLKVVEFIKDDTTNQRFNGAAAGLLKENLIAREMGLADRVQTTNTNHNFNANSKPLEADDIKKIAKALEDNF